MMTQCKVFIIYIGLLCLMPIQQYFSYIVTISFIGGGNRVPRVTDKLYHIMLYPVHLSRARFELTTLVLIGTDCIDSCKSNYHTITTMTVHLLFIIYLYFR